MTTTSDLPHVEHEGLLLEPVAGERGHARLSGIGEGEGAAALDRFLGLLHAQALAEGLREVKLQLESLEFINSSCLKAMVAWIYKVDTEGRPYRIRLRRDPGRHWQKTSLATLQRLAPEVVIVEDI